MENPSVVSLYVCSDLDALAADISENSINSQLVDCAHTLGRDPQFDKALLRLHPKPVGMEVWREPTSGLVVCVRYVISRNWLLAGYHTNPGHAAASSC